MKLPNLLYLDFESTGTNPSTDRIVEAAFLRPGEEIAVWKINPGVPIPAEATAIHGISDADVAGCPTFADLALRIQSLVEGAVLVHYNGRRFDVPLLDAELRRAGLPGLPRHPDGRLSVTELDAYSLWQAMEPRKLTTAAKRFAGQDLDNAHSAGADTAVLPAVIEGMIATFGLQGLSLDDLCALCVPEGEVDRDGKFKRREDGLVVFGFGKHQGALVQDHVDYLAWMLKQDFTGETKAFARKFIQVTGVGGRI